MIGLLLFPLFLPMPLLINAHTFAAGHPIVTQPLLHAGLYAHLSAGLLWISTCSFFAGFILYADRVDRRVVTKGKELPLSALGGWPSVRVAPLRSSDMLRSF